MAASLQTQQPTTSEEVQHRSVPRVLCPRCETQMRLAEIETDMRDRTMLRFDCRCGFEYKMSARARAER